MRGDPQWFALAETGRSTPARLFSVLTGCLRLPPKRVMSGVARRKRNPIHLCQRPTGPIPDIFGVDGKNLTPGQESFLAAIGLE